MLISSGQGFEESAVLARSRLASTVAASLAVGALSLCLIVTVLVLSVRIVAAMPLPV